jgi:hypothetical protein
MVEITSTYLKRSQTVTAQKKTHEQEQNRDLEEKTGPSEGL